MEVMMDYHFSNSVFILQFGPKLGWEWSIVSMKDNNDNDEKRADEIFSSWDNASSSHKRALNALYSIAFLVNVFCCYITWRIFANTEIRTFAFFTVLICTFMETPIISFFYKQCYFNTKAYHFNAIVSMDCPSIKTNFVISCNDKQPLQFNTTSQQKIIEEQTITTTTSEKEDGEDKKECVWEELNVNIHLKEKSNLSQEDLLQLAKLEQQIVKDVRKSIISALTLIQTDNK